MRRLIAWLDAYAIACLVFLMLVGVLFILVGLGCAFLGAYTVASSLIGAGAVIGVPAYCYLVRRHINPEGHK
jgi:hypothetical protein